MAHSVRYAHWCMSAASNSALELIDALLLRYKRAFGPGY